MPAAPLSRYSFIFYLNLLTLTMTNYSNDTQYSSTQNQSFNFFRLKYCR